jgi:hypothetical protein
MLGLILLPMLKKKRIQVELHSNIAGQGVAETL